MPVIKASLHPSNVFFTFKTASSVEGHDGVATMCWFLWVSMFSWSYDISNHYDLIDRPYYLPLLLQVTLSEWQMCDKAENHFPLPVEIWVLGHWGKHRGVYIHFAASLRWSLQSWARHGLTLSATVFYKRYIGEGSIYFQWHTIDMKLWGQYNQELILLLARLWKNWKRTWCGLLAMEQNRDHLCY